LQLGHCTKAPISRWQNVVPTSAGQRGVRDPG
jgi:hypothetical protein